MRWLLIGSGGLLGTAFRERLPEDAVMAPSRRAVDPLRVDAVAALVRDAQADVILNCAAHTDVEGAEGDVEASLRTNALLPGLLAQQARRTGALLVHVSSTGCYGSRETRPYTEEDRPEPTTVHHRSKMSGEAAVREAGCEALILRTGWLFGGPPASPKNFVWKRLLEASRAARLGGDATQTGNPTWTRDLVDQSLELVGKRLTGTFNCVGSGAATRSEYVAAIVEAAGLPCTVEPQTRPFARRAPVSANESAINFRLNLLSLDRMPPWRESLGRYVDELRSTPQWPELVGGDRPR